MKRKIKKPLIDGIQFDSGEEAEIYQHLKKGTLHKLTGMEFFKKWKLIDARPKGITLFEKFYAGEFLQRARNYKWDFTCKDENGEEVHLEYKSKWSEAKPDYRLRRFLVLFSKKLRFIELIKVRKGQYEFKRYF